MHKVKLTQKVAEAIARYLKGREIPQQIVETSTIGTVKLFLN